MNPPTQEKTMELESIIDKCCVGVIGEDGKGIYWRNDLIEQMSALLASSQDSFRRKVEEEEVCICAAVQLPNTGYVVRGHRHNDCYRTLQGMERWKNGSIGDVEDGFMTTRNRFVDRKEGLKLQKAAGIKSVDREGDYRGDELYSEDLY